MLEKILVIGSAEMDLTLHMHALPEAGGDATEDSRFGYSAGGFGTAAALALARLGADTLYVARLGNDNHGNRLFGLYREAGIDVRYVAVDPRAATGMRVAIREDNGDCRTVYYPGANAMLSQTDAVRAIADTAPAMIYLTGDIPAEVAAGATRLAAEAGIPTVVDATGAEEELSLSFFSPAEIFSIDDKDAFRETGTYPIGTDSCLKAAIELEKRVRARYYIIRLAERGLFVYDGRYCHILSPYNLRGGTPHLAEELTATVAAEYARNGGDIQGAARYALALSALMQKNGQDPNYFPQDSEIRALAAQH